MVLRRKHFNNTLRNCTFLSSTITFQFYFILRRHAFKRSRRTRHCASMIVMICKEVPAHYGNQLFRLQSRPNSMTQLEYDLSILQGRRLSYLGKMTTAFQNECLFLTKHSENQRRITSKWQQITSLNLGELSAATSFWGLTAVGTSHFWQIAHVHLLRKQSRWRETIVCRGFQCDSAIQRNIIRNLLTWDTRLRCIKCCLRCFVWE